VLIPQLAIGAVHLDDGVAAGLEEAREARAIRATALDPIGPNRSEGAGPGLQLLIAPATCRNGDRPEAGPERGEGNSGMGVLVRINADDHLGRIGFGHVRALQRVRPWRVPASGQDCDGRRSLKLL
jgi:hypothetical protein